MPCYHPMIRYENLNKPIKAKDGHTYYQASIYQTSIEDLPNALEKLKSNSIYKTQVIPCGKCIGCRLEYSREWANRGYLESKEWKQNWFCTITYDEEHLIIPEEFESENGITYINEGDWKGTLVPKDLTQFIKNVRQIMKREYNQNNIRFMAAGEYGEKGDRPHYHIIFFNLNLPVEDLFEPRISNNNVYYRSKIIERAWKKGISNISEANWNTIAYTARYITKKINGTGSEESYAEKGQLKEFFRVSRMPGIGEAYFRKHYKEIYEKDEIIIKNKEGTIATKPPKYYDYLYEQIDPKGFEAIKQKRRHEQKQAEKIKNEKTSNFRLEQKLIEERTHEEKHRKLVRTMEMGLN